MMRLQKRRPKFAKVAPPQDSVTAIDRELQSMIAQLSRTPREDYAQRGELLRDIKVLKEKRHKAVQPKSYNRMLAALG